jgi:hypothetical protein
VAPVGAGSAATRLDFRARVAAFSVLTCSSSERREVGAPVREPGNLSGLSSLSPRAIHRAGRQPFTMFVLEPRKLGNDLRSSAFRFADEVADRGRDVADRGRAAYYRLTSNRPDPIEEVRAIAAFTVGAVALIGVGYLVTRLVRRRLSSSNRAHSRNGSNRHGRSGRGSSLERREEPTHELLARLDSPEAIERHNEQVRQTHENARSSSERVTEHSTH